ncbi:MAG: sulfite exporter TauE/SafE family protein [Micropruina sp.]|uniref:sulfite exporter TauE/SafE family protein n=1 Tax=Micropruina sp. TaxID=2737536 RepID=UPI0039E51008
MPDISPAFVLAGLAVGFVVGLTGMGGGALMTPALVFFFSVNPLTAISSDVVTSLFMKPAGAIVHIMRKTAHLPLVFWLCVGSVPAAFLGAVFVDQLRIHDGFEQILLTILGVALLITAAGLIMRAWSMMLRYNSAAGEGPAEPERPEVQVKRLLTVLLGALGGLLVGLTSVGAGSLIITLLLFLYPTLRPSQLVGTDLVQAIPLVASASLGHLLFGEVSFGLTAALLIGAIPGAFIGAQVSSRAPGGLIRRALAILLMASGLKLVGASTEWVLISSGAAIVLGPAIWAVLRRRYRGVRAQQPAGQTLESGGDKSQ